MAAVCATEPGLVMKKREPLKTSLHFLSHSFQPPSFLLSLMLSKYAIMLKRQSSLTLFEMRLAISKYLTMFKVVAMFQYNALSK